MLKFLKQFYRDRPLLFIMVSGSLIRLISVLFSQGYGMHDDHFLVIEAAQSWVDGFDYNQWLPENSVTGLPTGHSFFYVGLHYLLFELLEYIQIFDPHIKMFIVRLIHGTWSMVTVYCGYKITEKISGSEVARIVGLLLALFWFFPILSVRNMVEMVCVPFTLLSLWYLYKNDKNWMNYFIAGLFMGMAVATRLQMYLFFGGIGIVLLFDRRIIGAVIFGISTLFALFLTQITDLFFWGYPFAEMGQYILYNSTHYDDYIIQSWYQYILLITGLLIPPVSFFLLFGFFRSWKKYLLIILPTLIFLVFHSIYPNKQERFILPVIPFIIMAGVAGWVEFRHKSVFWLKREKLHTNILRFFWILNVVVLLFISPASTKSSRVDSMYFLRELNDVKGILIERTTNYGCYLLPRFYHGDWTIRHYCYSLDEVKKSEETFLSDIRGLNYVFFVESENLEERLQKMKKYFPGISFIREIKPSYVDRLMHFLNPRNQNETIYIYRLF